MIKITNSLTKQEIVDQLEEVLASDKYVLKSKELVDMITYTLKKYGEKVTNVTKTDLLDVGNDLMEYLAPQQIELKPVEAKLKPVEEPTEKEAKPKPKAKAKPKAKPVKEEVVTIPEELDTDFGKYKLVLEGFENVKDVDQAIQDGRDIVFAVVWTPKMLKQYAYGGTDEYRDIKSFPDNMDISQPIYITEDKDGVYVLSNYTENMGKFRDNHFEIVDKVRYCNGAEWGLYENTDVEVEDIEEPKEEPVEEAVEPVEEIKEVK